MVTASLKRYNLPRVENGPHRPPLPQIDKEMHQKHDTFIVRMDHRPPPPRIDKEVHQKNDTFTVDRKEQRSNKII